VHDASDARTAARLRIGAAWRRPDAVSAGVHFVVMADDLHAALVPELVQLIVDDVLAAGSAGAAARLATVGTRYAAAVARALPVLFADRVAAAAAELRAAVALGAYDGLTSMCTLPAVRALVRFRDGLRVPAARYIHAWPRGHAATAAVVEPDALRPGAQARFLPVLYWLRGEHANNAAIMDSVPLALRACGDRHRVPCYVLYYVLRDILLLRTRADASAGLAVWHEGHGLFSLLRQVMEQWMAKDWAGCCVTLLSDFVLEPYGQTAALHLVFQHAMRLDLATLDGTLMLHGPRRAVVDDGPYAYERRLLPLFEFYRGCLCGQERFVVLKSRPPPLVKFTGLLIWSPGEFLDALGDDGVVTHTIRPQWAAPGARTDLPAFLCSLRGYLVLRDERDALRVPPAALPTAVKALIDASASQFF